MYCHTKKQSGISVEQLKKAFLKGLKSIGGA